MWCSWIALINMKVVLYRQIYNGFPAFWLAVFSMTWSKIQYNAIWSLKLFAISILAPFNCACSPNVANTGPRVRWSTVPQSAIICSSRKHWMWLCEMSSKMVEYHFRHCHGLGCQLIYKGWFLRLLLSLRSQHKSWSILLLPVFKWL